MSTQTTFQELAEAFRALTTRNADSPSTRGEFNGIASRATSVVAIAISHGLDPPPIPPPRAAWLLRNASSRGLVMAWPEVIAGLEQACPGTVGRWPRHTRLPFNDIENPDRPIHHALKTGTRIRWNDPPPAPETFHHAIQVSVAACDALANFYAEAHGYIEARPWTQPAPAQTEPTPAESEAHVTSPTPMGAKSWADIRLVVTPDKLIFHCNGKRTAWDWKEAGFGAAAVKQRGLLINLAHYGGQMLWKKWDRQLNFEVVRQQTYQVNRKLKALFPGLSSNPVWNDDYITKTRFGGIKMD